MTWTSFVGRFREAEKASVPVDRRPSKWTTLSWHPATVAGPERGTTPMPLQFAILYGSVREARQGIRAARFVEDQLRQRGHATFLVDAKECRLPLLDRKRRLKVTLRAG